MALKAFVRDTKIEEHELGDMMDRDHIAELNKSACGPLMSLRMLAHTARSKLPVRCRDSNRGLSGSFRCRDSNRIRCSSLRPWNPMNTVFVTTPVESNEHRVRHYARGIQ
eukprot:7380085-Prymnesium_polylepis.2